MMFLLAFLTVGNAFQYGQNATSKGVACKCSDIDDTENTNKVPVGSEEEKPTSKNLSSNLMEEYLHNNDLFSHLYITLSSLHNSHFHSHSFGDDHSRLHCPPPDALRFLS